jgi:hypothetical protein
MRKRFAVVPIAAAIAIFSIPSGASAATEIGNVCEADTPTGANVILAQLKDTSSALPQTPTAAGVITSWKMTEGGALPPLEQELKILAPGPAKNEFKVIAESAVEKLTPGVPASFPVRIPVQPGDILGTGSPSGSTTLLCAITKPGDTGGIHVGNLTPTDAADIFNEAPNFRLPVSATVEPDVDGDGFGDETQDKCPQSAQFQTECPQIGLEQFAVAGNGAVIDAVIADHEAPVTVAAKAKVPSGGGKHHAGASVAVALKGGTQTVVPGKFSKFKLKFSKPLKGALAGLPKGGSVKLRITASTKNLAGQVSSSTTTLKLKG